MSDTPLFHPRTVKDALATLVHAAVGMGPEDLDLLRRTQPPRTPPGLG